MRTGVGTGNLKNHTPLPLANPQATQLKSPKDIDKFSSEAFERIKESLKPPAPAQIQAPAQVQAPALAPAPELMSAPAPTEAPAKPKKKSWWKRLWGGIKKAFKRIGLAFRALRNMFRFLSRMFRALQQAFGNLGEKIGNWLSKAIGKTFGKVVGWIARVVVNVVMLGAYKILLKPFKLAWKLLTHPMKMMKAFIKAAVAFFKNPLKALGDAAAWIGGKVISKFMETVSAIQSFLGIETKGRSLKPEEIELLRSMYGDSIDYSKVVIKQGNLGAIEWFDSDRPFVIGNTIYIPSKSWAYLGADGSLEDNTLVHEMMHVWQYQNGGIDYLSKAIYTQLWGPSNPKGIGNDTGYYYNQDVVDGKPFEKLSPEQQAMLIEDAFKLGVLPPQNPPIQFSINGVDCTRYVLAAWEMVKRGQGTP